MNFARTKVSLASLAALAAWIAIGAGAFQQLYVKIHFTNQDELRRYWTEVPFRRLPGLRRLLYAVEGRTKPGDRILLWTPHRPWHNGYGYAFRRAQYVLAGRDVLPAIDYPREAEAPQNLARADFVACWRECPPIDGFRVVWRSPDGELRSRIP